MIRDESKILAALLEVAERIDGEERAAFFIGAHYRGRNEAERIAHEHGFGPDRLAAMKSLARHRGVDLEVVLRAALRGGLRDIVTTPPA